MPESVNVTSLAIRLERVSGQIDGHIESCELRADAATKAMGELATAVTAVKTEITEFKALPMKAVRWLGGIVIIAAVTLLTQNFILHQESTAKATQAASEATVAAGNTNQVLGVVKSIKAAQASAATPP
jgi:hypothetical protein